MKSIIPSIFSSANISRYAIQRKCQKDLKQEIGLAIILIIIFLALYSYTDERSISAPGMPIEVSAVEKGDVPRVRIHASGDQAIVPTLAEATSTKNQDAKACHAGLRFVM